MAELVELLEWDSELFGFTVGRTELDGATPARLRQIAEEARELGIRCLYGQLDPIDRDAAQLVQLHGHRLVDVALTFRRPEGPFIGRTTEARVRRGSVDDLPQLEDALATLVPWSRFGADPKFGAEASTRMLRAWVERAARDDDRMLAIAEDDTGVVGVSTHVREEPVRIDLMGVTKPRSGAAWALMAEFLDWAGPGAVLAGPCMARNVAVLRYLEHCGYAVTSVEYRYHWWADEQPEVTP